jgi:hypothetical protein
MRVLGGFLIAITVLLVVFGFIFGRDYNDFSFLLALPWFAYAIVSGISAMFCFWFANLGDNIASLERTNRKILEYLAGQGTSRESAGVAGTSTSSSTPAMSAQHLHGKQEGAAKAGDYPGVPRNLGESDAHYWERVSRS